MNLINRYIDKLSCPDDFGTLKIMEEYVECQKCFRKFPIIADNFLEILPIKVQELPESVSKPYREGYLYEFYRKFHWLKDAKAWGALEEFPSHIKDKRIRQVEFIKTIILTLSHSLFVSEFIFSIL